MADIRECHLTFFRLSDVSPDRIIAHMSDPRVKAHMPLNTFEWGHDTVSRFVAAKEACWRRDGLGHWAIFCNRSYAGWGGFERDADTWDYGLVLTPKYFGLGMRITRKAIRFALDDERISTVTFLLPHSRKKRGALARLGASFVGDVEFNGARFLKFKLDTRSLISRSSNA